MAVSCSRPRQPDQLGLAVAVPRKLTHDDDAQAAAVGGDVKSPFGISDGLVTPLKDRLHT